MVKVGRRGFLAGGIALLVVPVVCGAQTAGKPARIGILRAGPDDSVFRRNFGPFVPELRERGFAEGKNLSVEYRVRPGRPEEILQQASDLVRAKVDAILAIAAPGVRAASKVTSSIPIVAVDLESDPIAEGFANSLARPGGNITGLFLDFPELSGKWIELLKEAMPGLSRAAVLVDPAIGPYLIKGAVAAGEAMQVQIFRLEARTPAELASAFEVASRQKAQAILVLSSPVFASARKEIAAFAVKHRLPAIMPFPEFADDGGLMGYGPHLTSMFRQAGSVMAKVLLGTHPREIPIERPTRFELVVNRRTAAVLAMTIPPTTRLRADRVID